MEDLLAWLRATIEGDKAAAEALPHGPWHVELGRRGYPQCISNAAAILIAETYTGPEHEPEIANYIALHDPRDTIARCEAELAFLDAMISIVDELDSIAYGEGQAAMNPDRPQEPLHGACGYLVKRFAEAYRHRPGFRPSWLD